MIFSHVSLWATADNKHAMRDAMMFSLRRMAPRCDRALYFIVAELLSTDYSSDVLLNLADALREAAAELLLDGPTAIDQVLDLRTLADLLAEDAPLHRGCA